jgi:hypothetical protein
MATSPRNAGSGPPGAIRIAARSPIKALAKGPVIIVHGPADVGAYQVTLDELLLESLPPHIARWITIDPESGCWLWTGPLDRDGYGKYRGRGAHRVVYTLLVGPVPVGLVLDHREDWGCLSKACCYPGHLLPVTNYVNTMRAGTGVGAINAAKIKCDHGHPFTPSNTYVPPGRPRRACRCCNAAAVRRYKSRLRDRGQFAEAA